MASNSWNANFDPIRHATHGNTAASRIILITETQEEDEEIDGNMERRCKMGEQNW